MSSAQAAQPPLPSTLRTPKSCEDRVRPDGRCCKSPRVRKSHLRKVPPRRNLSGTSPVSRAGPSSSRLMSPACGGAVACGVSSAWAADGDPTPAPHPCPSTADYSELFNLQLRKTRSPLLMCWFRGVDVSGRLEPPDGQAGCPTGNDVHVVFLSWKTPQRTPSSSPGFVCLAGSGRGRRPKRGH